MLNLEFGNRFVVSRAFAAHLRRRGHRACTSPEPPLNLPLAQRPRPPQQDLQSAHREAPDLSMYTTR